MMLPAIFLVTLAAPQDAAVQVTDDLPAASPAVAQASIDAGLAHFKKRHFTQAEAEFQKAVDADPAGAAAHFYLGYTVYKIAEPKRPFHPEKQRAAELFAKAYDLDPEFRPVWGRRVSTEAYPPVLPTGWPRVALGSGATVSRTASAPRHVDVAEGPEVVQHLLVDLVGRARAGPEARGTLVGGDRPDRVTLQVLRAR